MQKTFIRYTAIIMSAAILVILVIYFLFDLHLLKAQQYAAFYAKTEQMIHTLENNQMELALLRENLDEDYLTRARAAAYVVDTQKEISMDVGEMQYLAALLNVDELHIISEEGIIAFSSVSQYVGFDMAAHQQTSPFLDLLGRSGEDAYLIQEAQPNAAENKIMQYVGVARKEQVGVVQVGFTPTRQMEAQSRNTYDYIFSRFPTDIGEELFVADAFHGDILGHSDGLGRAFDADCYRLDLLPDCTEGAFRKGSGGTTMFMVSRRYADIWLCAALPRRVLFRKLWGNITEAFFCLFFIEIVVILLLNYLVRKQVINGIHDILEKLDSITKGNLDTKVAVGGNREFEELSRGINTMVRSIVNLSDRISAIIEISGISLAVFEYEKGRNRLFATSGLSSLLGLSEGEAKELYRDSSRFDEYFRFVMKMPVKDEEEIYQTGEDRYLRIHLSESSEGCFGIVTDVTKDIRQKKKLRYENTHDPLTGLYKFDYFKELSAEKMEKMSQEKVCAVAMLDLDHFKAINDVYGHDAGDRYLQGFADVMRCMPREHTMTARRSGDEFCMMLFDCENEGEITAHLDAFYGVLQGKEVILGDGQTLQISVSCGYAPMQKEGDDITQLLSRADEALYEVKRSSKGKYARYQQA